MTFLVDTNVLSEVRRPRPSLKVLTWLDRVDEDRTFVSVVSLAELRRGIALMDPGRRREALENWLAEDLSERFAGRVLPVDSRVAERWGDLMAVAKESGRALSTMDGFLAATALVHDLTMVTHNSRGFAAFGLDLLDPWEA